MLRTQVSNLIAPFAIGTLRTEREVVYQPDSEEGQGCTYKVMMCFLNQHRKVKEISHKIVSIYNSILDIKLFECLSLQI